jgi:DNA-binding transcriptional MerR regulator
MCARFDVTPRTLRYYEYIELLGPRKEGRARIYGPREVARMTLILRGRRFGFALDEIRRWLDLHDAEGSRAQTRAWVERADEQIGELTRQRDELDATIRELKRLRDESAAALG